MVQLSVNQAPGHPRWPMTREACDRLENEIRELRAELTALTGQGLEEGIVRLPFTLASRRLEVLGQMLEWGDVVDEPIAAIGCRTTLRDERGETVYYSIVLPGEGDPEHNSISADSSMAAAMLGARPGDTVTFAGARGPLSATVVAVD